MRHNVEPYNLSRGKCQSNSEDPRLWFITSKDDGPLLEIEDAAKHVVLQAPSQYIPDRQCEIHEDLGERDRSGSEDIGLYASTCQHSGTILPSSYTLWTGGLASGPVLPITARLQSYHWLMLKHTCGGQSVDDGKDVSRSLHLQTLIAAVARSRKPRLRNVSNGRPEGRRDPNSASDLFC